MILVEEKSDYKVTLRCPDNKANRHGNVDIINFYNLEFARMIKSPALFNLQAMLK